MNWQEKQEEGHFLFPGRRSEVTGLELVDTRRLNDLFGHVVYQM